MPSQRESSWTSLFKQQRDAFRDIGFASSGDLDGEDVFLAAVEAVREAQTQGSGFQASLRLTPALGRMNSLVTIVSLTAGVPPSSTLIWDSGLALLKTGLETDESHEDVLGLLNTLNEMIPRLDIAPDSVISHRSKVEAVYGLYTEYVEYCVFASRKYIQQRGCSQDRQSQSTFHTAIRRELHRVRDRIRVHEKCLGASLEQPLDASIDGDEDSRTRKTPSANGTRNATAAKYKKFIAHILPPKFSQFVKRDSELDAIQRALQPNDPDGMNQLTQCVLHGMGGVGKTETALEYAYRHMSDYEAVFWIDAEQETQRVRAYTRIGKKLGRIKEEVQVGGAEEIDQTREKLEDMHERWLLIFDNVERFSDVSLFVPNTVKGYASVIFTTQKANLGPKAITPILIEPFAPKDGSALLLQEVKEGIDDNLTNGEREALAESISEMFGGHPIVLAMAGGFIKQAGVTLADYLEELKESTSPWPDRGREAAGRYTNPNACFGIALRQLPSEARQLIHILAFLNPEVSDELLVFDHEDPDLAFLSPKEKSSYHKAAYDLRDRNLVKRQRMSTNIYHFQIHRFLQHNVHQSLTSEPKLRPAIEKAFLQTLHILRRATPKASPIQVPTPELWVQFEKTLPHLISFQAAVTNINVRGTLEYALLLSDAGMNMWERGLSADGLRLLEAAEKTLKDLDSKEKLVMANINVIIVLLIWDHGISRRKESLERIAEALRIRQEHQNNTLKPDSPKVLTNDGILLHNAWSDYAVTLLQFHRVSKAEPIFETCLAKYKEWGTEDEIPYEYAKYYHHKAFCNLYRGKMDDAITHAQKGLSLMRRSTADDSSLAYRFQFDLACILFQTEDIGSALKLHKEVLEKRLGHGKYSFLTLQSYYALGSLKAHLLEFEAAEEYMRLALDGARKGSWPEVAIARTEYHLAKVLRVLGKLGDDVDNLESTAKQTLRRLLPLDPLDNVPEDDELALFDHMQPVFDARFAGRGLLQYVSCKEKEPGV